MTSNDTVERLRKSAELVDAAGVFDGWSDTYREAADLIEALTKAPEGLETTEEDRAELRARAERLDEENRHRPYTEFLPTEILDFLRDFDRLTALLNAERERADDWQKRANDHEDARERAEAALESCSSWLERWGTHVVSCEGGTQCTCGLTAISYEARTALSKPEEQT